MCIPEMEQAWALCALCLRECQKAFSWFERAAFDKPQTLSCGVLASIEGGGMQTEVMTVHELCDYLQVSRGTIYRLLRTDGIPAFRVGSDWRFTRSRIEE